MEHALRLYSPFPSSFNMPYEKSSKKSSEKQKQKQKQKQKSPQEPALPTSPYKLSGLYEKHFPEWNIDSKQAEVVDRLQWAINVRYKVGEYSKTHKGFPIYIKGDGRASASALSTTRIYIPARYRPILRLLNSKMAWHKVCLTIPAPQKPKDPNMDYNIIETHALQTRRHSVWRDGARRNIIYCSSVRESFFEWVEQEYYGGKDATGLVPRQSPMDGSKRCIEIENWMMHELVAKTHILSEIRLWSSLRSSNQDRWRKIRDVFDLGSFYSLQLNTSSTNYEFSLDWDELGQSLPWYGAPLNPAIEDDAQTIQYQTALGMKPHPLIEDFDQIRHAHSQEIKDFYQSLMQDDFSALTPVRPVSVVNLVAMSIN